MRNLIIPLLVCIACAVVVSITAVTVRTEQIANVENEKKNKIISAAGIEITEDQVENEFKKITTLYVDFRSNEFVSVEEKYDHLKAVLKSDLSEIVPKDKDIAILKRRENVGPIYVWTNENKEVERVVLPIRGYGLWGTLYGYLSLGSDLNSVNGIEFYDHKETPGLGGEVENEDWKAIWKGKLIYNQDAPLALPLDSLGEVDKKIVDQVMDKTVLDFFNYSLKGQPFDIKNNNTYNNQVIYNTHP